MGKLEKIKLLLQSMLQEYNQVTTDKGILKYDGEEIEVGMTVRKVDEEGNETTVEDGEYFLGEEDGRTIVVENSTVTEIKAKEEEPQSEQLNSKQVKFNKVKLAFEESYGEKENRIIDAIRKTGNYDCYLIEAGDTYAIVDEWVDEIMDYKYFRYEISWGEDGSVIVGEKSEVKSAFVPVETNVEEVAEEQFEENKTDEAVVEDIVEEIKETAEDTVEDTKEDNTQSAEQRIADLEALVAELKTRLAELEKEPAAESATEEFKSQNKVSKTGNRKLDNLAAKLGIN